MFLNGIVVQVAKNCCSITMYRAFQKKTGPCFISLYLWQFITIYGLVIHLWLAVSFHYHLIC